MSAEMIADVWNVDPIEIVKTLKMMQSPVTHDAWMELIQLGVLRLPKKDRGRR